MIRRDRICAQMKGDFVVFLIGMRINKPLLVHKWLPVVLAMPPMLRELRKHPELGFLHAETWYARTIFMVQYWRSLDQLLAYAKNRDALHLPAWRAYNKAVGKDGTVGVWHETYVIAEGKYENMYVNMPPFGLGSIGSAQSATGEHTSAAGRLRLDALDN